MGCGIESGAKTVARFILCGMIHLGTTEASKKANKYTFWSLDPRGKFSLSDKKIKEKSFGIAQFFQKK